MGYRMQHIDRKRLGALLCKHSTQEQLDIQYLINNLRYVTTVELLSEIRKVIELYVRSHQKFYIYDNGYKWGSENWLTVEFYEMLGKPQIITKGDLSYLPKGVRILIIDDCVYSGGNIGRTLNDLRRNMRPPYCVDLILGFATRSGLDYLRKLSNTHNVTLNAMVGQYTPSITEIVQRDMYPMNWSFFDSICCLEPNNHDHYDDKPFEDLAIIFFEYKIAAYNSTVKGLLNKIMDEPTVDVVTASAAKKNILVPFVNVE